MIPVSTGDSGWKCLSLSAGRYRRAIDETIVAFVAPAVDSKKFTASVVAHVAGSRFVLLDALAVDADAGISLANETLADFRDLVESLKGSAR